MFNIFGELTETPLEAFVMLMNFIADLLEFEALLTYEVLRLFTHNLRRQFFLPLVTPSSRLDACMWDSSSNRCPWNGSNATRFLFCFMRLLSLTPFPFFILCHETTAST